MHFVIDFQKFCLAHVEKFHCVNCLFQLKLANQISYVSGEKMKIFGFVCDTRAFSEILWSRTNVPKGFFVTGSLLDRRHHPCNCLLNLAFASIDPTIIRLPSRSMPLGSARGTWTIFEVTLLVDGPLL